jgi:N-methylhydantoinase B
VKAIAVEVTEATTPLVVWKKELRADSGGAGRLRGGLGQVMEIGSREDAPFAIFARFQRVDFPARGRNGGKDGAAGIVRLGSGTMLKSRGNQVIPKGDRLIVEMPGGGGLGNAAERDPVLVVEDIRDGYITRASAREVYKVVVRDDLSVDAEGTAKLRGRRS